MFDKIVEALVFGCGYEPLGDASCSATTLRRRRDEWIAAGVFDALRRDVLAADERLIGLDLADVSVDGCITKAPCGGECAGRSPVDRAKQGLKRSQLSDGGGSADRRAACDVTLIMTAPATLDVLTGLLAQVGAVPKQTTLLWTPATTTGPTAPSSPSEGCRRGSPGAGSRTGAGRQALGG